MRKGFLLNVPGVPLPPPEGPLTSQGEQTKGAPSLLRFAPFRP